MAGIKALPQSMRQGSEGVREAEPAPEETRPTGCPGMQAPPTGCGGPGRARGQRRPPGERRPPRSEGLVPAPPACSSEALCPRCGQSPAHRASLRPHGSLSQLQPPFHSHGHRRRHTSARSHMALASDRRGCPNPELVGSQSPRPGTRPHPLPRDMAFHPLDRQGSPQPQTSYLLNPLHHFKKHTYLHLSLYIFFHQCSHCMGLAPPQYVGS